jgi:hypothetical protein
MTEVSNLDRRINYIQAQQCEVDGIIDEARVYLHWPEYAIVPYLKMRARLRREHEAMLALKNKREVEKQDRKRMLEEHNRKARKQG